MSITRGTIVNRTSIVLSKSGESILVGFCLYRRSYLLCPPPLIVVGVQPLRASTPSILYYAHEDRVSYSAYLSLLWVSSIKYNEGQDSEYEVFLLAACTSQYYGGP